ncbi:MAG: uncharacterized protein JWR26_903 [Pedosphaera sp.]|nr:uncharacterized protein [Pedosphaera sp.]
MNGYESISERRGWFIALGVALIVLGMIAIAMAVLTTLISVMIFGWLLLLGGIVQSVHAFWVRPWSGMVLQLVIGILNLVVGLLIVANPGASALALTLLMGAFFIVGGLFRVITAAVRHYPGRGWTMFSGIINLLLGVLILAQWPASAFWVIGMFIGIDLVFTGWWFIMLIMLTRRLTPSVPAT